MRVYGGVSYSCFTSNTVSDYDRTWFILDVTSFIPSTTRNRFKVIGCSTLGILQSWLFKNKTRYGKNRLRNMPCHKYIQT
jgi:hypothetical protein